MTELKFSILEYIQNLGLYDYLAFAWLFLTFLILIILSIIIMKKAIKTSMFVLLLSLILLLIGPFFIKHYLNKTLRRVDTRSIQFQKLNFSNTLIVNYKIKNLSKKSFKECEIHITVYRPSASKLKLFLNKLKPIEQKTILIKEPINANDFADKRFVFDNFSYNRDINVSVEAQCY